MLAVIPHALRASGFFLRGFLDRYYEMYFYLCILCCRLRAYQKGARRATCPGSQVQRGLMLKGCLNFKRSCWRDHLPQKTYSVNFKFDCKQRNFFKKYSKLDSLGCFLISPLYWVFLSVYLHQWLQVNALSMCWNTSRTITVQLWNKVVWLVSPRSISTVTLHES
jgi:hypothetical protein